MKNALLLLFSLFLLSCGNKDAAIADTGSPSGSPEPSAVWSAEEKGKALVEGSDCLACHQVKEKIIGPSYEEIAAKYSEKDISYLAGKIMEGGSGVWGAVPMSAHPGLAKEDAENMVKYILSLKQ